MKETKKFFLKYPDGTLGILTLQRVHVLIPHMKTHISEFRPTPVQEPPRIHTSGHTIRTHLAPPVILPPIPVDEVEVTTEWGPWKIIKVERETCAITTSLASKRT